MRIFARHIQSDRAAVKADERDQGRPRKIEGGRAAGNKDAVAADRAHLKADHQKMKADREKLKTDRQAAKAAK